MSKMQVTAKLGSRSRTLTRCDIWMLPARLRPTMDIHVGGLVVVEASSRFLASLKGVDSRVGNMKYFLPNVSPDFLLFSKNGLVSNIILAW